MCTLEYPRTAALLYRFYLYYGLRAVSRYDIASNDLTQRFPDILT